MTTVTAYRSRLASAPFRPRARRESPIPVYRTIGYTLDISVRFLLSALVGNGTIARGDALLHSWSSRILASGNVTLHVDGVEHFAPGQPVVVMSNHRSLLDVPTVFQSVPGSIRMVMKEELLKVPVWGPAMVGSGFIPIDRKNTEKAIEQLAKAKQTLERGVHVWVSPEGTRSRDGSLGTFKKGGFHLAKDLEVPILPMWIEGSDEIVPPDTFIARYDRDLFVRFGPPISTSGTTTDSLPALMDTVRCAMLALGRERSTVGARPHVDAATATRDAA